MPGETPRLGLSTFEQGEEWDHTDTVEAVDEHVIEHGPIADRPTEGDYDDELYHATDQGITWRWVASSSDWEYFSGQGSSDQPVPGTSHYEALSAGEIGNGGSPVSFTDPLLSPIDNKVRQVGAGDSIQSALDAVSNADARRSGVVKFRGAGETGDYLQFSNDTLPIVPPEGTTLDLTGAAIIYSDPVSDAVFDLQHPRTTIIAPGAQFWFTGAGSGDIIRFSDVAGDLSSRQAPQVFGYPMIRTDGEFAVAHDQSNGNAVVGCYSEIQLWNADNGIRFSSSGTGGWVNGNVTRVRGSMDSGNFAVFEGAETAQLNRVEIDELNIVSGVDHVGLWDGAGINKNVIRGTWFDEALATTPFEWTSGTGGNNKAIRRNPSVASGTNNSGDSTNETVADMTL